MQLSPALGRVLGASGQVLDGAGALGTPAGHAAAVEHAPLGRAELQLGGPRLKGNSQGARAAGSAEGQTPGTRQVRARATAGARHVLGQAVAATEALEVVFVTVHDHARAPAEGVPQRRDVGGVAVRWPGAEPWPVPEGEAAGCRVHATGAAASAFGPSPFRGRPRNSG